MDTSLHMRLLPLPGEHVSVSYSFAQHCGSLIVDAATRPFKNRGETGRKNCLLYLG